MKDPFSAQVLRTVVPDVSERVAVLCGPERLLDLSLRSGPHGDQFGLTRNLNDLLGGNEIFQLRTKGIGVVSREMALA